MQETLDQTVAETFDIARGCVLLEPPICLSIVVDRYRVKAELSDLLKNALDKIVQQ